MYSLVTQRINQDDHMFAVLQFIFSSTPNTGPKGWGILSMDAKEHREVFPLAKTTTRSEGDRGGAKRAST